MAESTHRTDALLTNPVALAIWWAAAVVLTAHSIRGFPERFGIPVIVVAAFAAAVLIALVMQHRELNNWTRVTAYVCVFAATQTVWVFFAIEAMTPGLPFSPGYFGYWDLAGMVFGGPALSLWTFFLIRAWVSQDEEIPSRTGCPGWWRGVSMGCAAASAFIVVLIASNLTNNMLIGLLGVPDVDYPMDAEGAEEWMVTAIQLGLAGVAEEPVFVGVAMLLWSRFTVPNFLAALWLSSLARAAIHLYYAAGAGAATATAIGLVIVWCTMWSGFSLFLVYRTRMIWPVMLGHGLQNSLGVVAALISSFLLSPQEEAVASVLMLTILAVLAVLAIGTLVFLVITVRRIWFQRFAPRPAAEPRVLSMVPEVGVSS